MTKKDYELIARHLKDEHPRSAYGMSDEATVGGYEEAIDAVADALASDNPRFDRFLVACGVGP